MEISKEQLKKFIREELVHEKLIGKGYTRDLIQKLQDLRKTLDLFDTSNLHPRDGEMQNELLTLASDVSSQLKYLRGDFSVFRERMAMNMGPNAGGGAFISDMDQEMIDYMEKELGTSNFFDEVMERIPNKQRSGILSSIAKEYKFIIGGVERL